MFQMSPQMFSNFPIILITGYRCSAKTSKDVKEEIKRTATRNGEARETEIKGQKRIQEGKEGSILERKV